MDVIHAVRHYLEKIITDPQLEGMKALILDPETTTIISMVMSQSQILQREVFLVEQLDAPTQHERMSHLKAAVFVRPTSSNIELLNQELKNPKFGSYHLFFSNMLPIDLLERLAENDEKELITQVQEYYADYLAINDCLFHFNLRDTIPLSLRSTPPPSTISAVGLSSTIMTPKIAQLFNRSVEGMLALLLSLKKKPTIRYQKGSEIAEKLAREVSARMQLEQDGLFDFRRPEIPPLLYVLDRKDDPVTPLLSQWNYQAMVHELLGGLQENRVSLVNAPNVRKDMQELVLSSTSDVFFKEQMYANFGDLGMAVKKLVEEYQAKTSTHENINSIEDMQKFLENYPAFRSQSLTVSKHVALMGELARLVQIEQLMDVSALEQDIACNDDHTTHLKELIGKLKQGEIKNRNKLRLAILYLLRYETNSSVQIKLIRDLLLSSQLNSEEMILFDSFLKYGGTNVRGGDLFGEKNGLKKFMKAMTQGVQGVPNVYAQHVPPLMKILDQILKGHLLDTDFGIVNGQATPGIKKVKDIIIFICGGVTFEEAQKIAELNQKIAPQGQKIIIGGTFIHNSTTFLQEVGQCFTSSTSFTSSTNRRASSYTTTR